MISIRNLGMKTAFRGKKKKEEEKKKKKGKRETSLESLGIYGNGFVQPLTQ